MICDARTCAGCRYLERDERDDPATSLVEFLADCQHAKCKVVRLVRQQISKLQNMQYERFPKISPNEERVDAYNDVSQNDGTKPHETFYGEAHEIYDEIHELLNDQYEVEAKIEQTHKETYDEETYEMQKASTAITRQTDEATNAARQAVRLEDAVTAPLRRMASPGRMMDRKLMLWVLDCIRHRAHLILAAATLGVIAWTALVYGVFLGATACGNSRGCYAYSLRYAHAKRSLF